jgi:nucleotide-binding universal stress UspA family protein
VEEFSRGGDTVFQHILFATDGSPASQVAAEACVRFAAQVKARLTILHVMANVHHYAYEPGYVEPANDTLRHNREEQARRCLEPVETAARNAQVAFDSAVVQADEPSEAIVSTARDKGCDLIAMASHGRRGVRAVLLGSQTQKVLTHSALPVLVFR